MTTVAVVLTIATVACGLAPERIFGRTWPASAACGAAFLLLWFGVLHHHL